MGFSNLRADRGQLNPPITATIYEGRVARTHSPGDALAYRTGPEHRDSTELVKIVDQLPNLKIYLGHPDIYPASNSGQKVVGTVESGRLDEDTAVARMAITDAEALEAIEAGTHELSLGYQCVLDGDRYQRNIILDHLAIVPVARCGSTCSMRVDMEEVVMETETKETNMEIGTHTIKVDVQLTDAAKETLNALEKLAHPSADFEATFRQALDAMSAMGKVKCDNCDAMYEKGTSHTCAPKTDHEGSSGDCTCKNRAMSHTSGETTMADTELQGKLDAALAEVASLKEKVTTLEVEATNARKDADMLKTQIESAQAEATKAKEDAAAEVAKAKTDASDALVNEMNARVDARVALLLEAGKVLKDQDLKALSDREIKCAVIKHIDGDDVPAEKSNDYVTGVYEGALKRANSASASRETVRTALNDMRKDNAAPVLKGADLEKAAKEQMHRESAQAWTK